MTAPARDDRFRAIADAMPMLMWTTAGDGQSEWRNRRWYEYTGHLDGAASAKLRDVVHPDDRGFTSERWKAGLRDGTPVEMMHRLRRHDGTYRWHLTRTIPERDESGAVQRWYGTSTDVDEARRAQRTLHIFSELGRILSASLELEPTLDAVMHVVVPEFADWAFINLADENGELRVAATYHSEPAKRDVLARQHGKTYARPGFESGAARAIRLGEPVLYQWHERSTLTAVAPDILDAFESVGVGQAMVVPLIVGTLARATLSVVRVDRTREFSREEVAFFQELARRIAPAIANAQLFERERLVARSFQEAALPAELPNVPTATFSAIYEAGRSEALIGGDWFDAFALADGRIVLSIGDVAGSGLQAAVTMANMRQAIRGVAYVHPDPALMLEAADLAERSEAPDLFVTAFVAVLDPIEDTISYAGAGHPAPLMRIPSGDLVPLEASGLPLGLREHDGGAGHSRGIVPGSMLVLYTDGLIESTHDLNEGFARLDAAVRDPQLTESEDPAAAIRDAVLIEGARDDVAILCCRYHGSTLARHRVDVRNRDESARFAALLVGELARHGYKGEAILNAEVVLAELVGNLVRHAPGAATFVIDAQPGRVILHVLDDGPGYRFLSRLPTDTFSERGRGLFLISALSDAFHVTPRPFGGSHACVTFATVSSDAAQRIRSTQTSAPLRRSDFAP